MVNEAEIQRLQDDIAGYDYYINAGINVNYFLQQKAITQARIYELTTTNNTENTTPTNTENKLYTSTITEDFLTGTVRTTAETPTGTINIVESGGYQPQAIPSTWKPTADLVPIYTNPPQGFDTNLYEGTYGKDYVAVKNPSTGETVFTTPESVQAYQTQGYYAPPSSVESLYGKTLTFTRTKTTTFTPNNNPLVSEPVVSLGFGSVDLTTDFGKIRSDVEANKFYSQYGSYLQDRGISNSLLAGNQFFSNIVLGAGSFVESTGLTNAFSFFNNKYSSATSVSETDLPIMFGDAELVNPNPTSFVQLFDVFKSKDFVWTKDEFGFVDKPTVLSGSSMELAKQLDVQALVTVNEIESNNALALKQEQWNRLNPKSFFAYQQELATEKGLSLYPNANPFWGSVGAFAGSVVSGQVLFPSISFTSLVDKPFVSNIQSNALVEDVYAKEYIYDDFGDVMGYREVGKGVPIASVKSTVYVTNPLDSSKDFTVNVLGKQIYKGVNKISGGGYLVETAGYSSAPDSYWLSSTIIKPSYTAPSTSWVLTYGDDFIEWTPTNIPSTKIKDAFKITTVSNIRSEVEPFTQIRATGDLYKSGNILIFKGSTGGDVGINAWTLVDSKAVLPKLSDYQYDVFVNPTFGDKIDDTLNALSKGLSINKKAGFNAYGGSGSSVLSADENLQLFQVGAEASQGSMAGYKVGEQLFTQSVAQNFATTSKFSPLVAFGGSGGVGVTKPVSTNPVVKPVVFTNPSIKSESVSGSFVVSMQGSALKPIELVVPKPKVFSAGGTNTIVQEVVITKPVTKVNTITKTALTFTPVSFTPFGFGNPNFTPKGLPFGLDLPKFGGGGLRYGSGGARGGKRTTQYTPNVYSIATGFRVKKQGKQTLFSGGEIKPMIGSAPKPFKFGLPKVKKKKLKMWKGFKL